MRGRQRNRAREAARTGPRLSHAWRGWLGVALVTFACRALVPAGFMPAPLAEGGPLVVCPGGTAGALFAAFASSAPHDHGHADRDHGGQEDRDGAGEYDPWQHCPVGSLLASAGLAAEASLPLLTLDHVFSAAESVALVPPARPGSYWARGPPSV